MIFCVFNQTVSLRMAIHVYLYFGTAPTTFQFPEDGSKWTGANILACDVVYPCLCRILYLTRGLWDKTAIFLAQWDVQ